MSFLKLFACVLASSVVSLATSSGADPAKEKASLQGAWKGISVVHSGGESAVPGELVKAINVVFSGDQATLSETKASPGAATQQMEVAYVIDASASPKTIDFVIGPDPKARIVG